MIASVDELIETLGDTGAVASALGLAPSTVSSWRARRSIPSDHWPALVDLARSKEINGVTFEELAALNACRAAEPAEARP